MAMVRVVSGSLYRRTHSLSRLAWSWVGGHLAPFYIHQTNRVNSRNGLCHDDSTINIVLELLLLLFTTIQFLDFPCVPSNTNIVDCSSETRNAARLKRVKSDASESTHLILTFDLWHPYPQCWTFHALAAWTNCANLHQTRFIHFQNIMLTSTVTDERTQVENTMPTARLAPRGGIKNVECSLGSPWGPGRNCCVKGKGKGWPYSRRSEGRGARLPYIGHWARR